MGESLGFLAKFGELIKMKWLFWAQLRYSQTVMLHYAPYNFLKFLE
jgi:hypothetical protein